MAVYDEVDDVSGRVVWPPRGVQGVSAFAEFLERVAETWAGETVVQVIDDVSYRRAPGVRAQQAAQAGRIILFWLPVYEPHVNVIERVRRFINHKLACHRRGADAAGLEALAAYLLARANVRVHIATLQDVRLVSSCCESAWSEGRAHGSETPDSRPPCPTGAQA